MNPGLITRSLLIGSLLLTGSTIANAQNGDVPPPPPPPGLQQTDDGKIFHLVGEQPMFPGGEGAMMQYLGENIKYPKDSRKKGIQGTVFITFVVGKEGEIQDVKVARGVAEDLDEEAIRVIKAMPNWIPGKMEGKPVRVQFNIPIKYSLR